MVVSVLFGTLAVFLGLLVSFYYGTAGGATMAGFSVLQFFIVLAGRSLLRRARKLRIKETLEDEMALSAKQL